LKTRTKKPRRRDERRRGFLSFVRCRSALAAGAPTEADAAEGEQAAAEEGQRRRLRGGRHGRDGDTVDRRAGGVHLEARELDPVAAGLGGVDEHALHLPAHVRLRLAGGVEAEVLRLREDAVEAEGDV